MNRDAYSRRIFSEEEIINVLYKDPSADISMFNIPDASKHNLAIDANYSDLSKLNALEVLSVTPEAWHAHNQTQWHMPDAAKEFDIAAWILDQCNGNEVELQRCAAELLEYAERGLLPLLAYLKYLVDTLRANNVVWGVGRGSSVASFVLYKIGIHRINSIEYDLDFNEFMR